MSSLNDLVRELNTREIVKALLNAYKLGDRNYLESALSLIHEETTFVVSENEGLTNDTIKRVSILHALFITCLGMIEKLKGGVEESDYMELISKAIKENDLTLLTKALTGITIKALNGDHTWIASVRSTIEGSQATLIISIIEEFLNIINLIITS